MSNILTAEQMVSAKAYKTRSIEALGGTLVVRTLPMGGRIAMKTQALSAAGKIDDLKFAAVTLCYGVVAPRLTMEQAEQVIAEQPSEEVEPILAAIWELSGLGEVEAKNG